MSYQNDLDWLARNVHGWHGDLSRLCYVSHANDEPAAIFPLNLDPDRGYSRDQWLARRAELQNKPSWKDAPEWAEWLAQDADGAWWRYECMPEKCEDGWWSEFVCRPSSTGEVLGNWRTTLEKRPDTHKNHEEIDTSAERVQKPAESMYVEHESPVDMAMSIIGADSLEPEFKPVSVSNETVQLERPIAVAGTGNGSAAESAFLIGRLIDLLRTSIDHFSAGELADLNELTGAELTKRDERVCGGQKYLDATWFERGELPPVGVDCQAYVDECWVDAYVVGFIKNGAVTVDVRAYQGGVKSGLRLVTRNAAHFRPIRTERDLAVDEMKRHCPYHGSWETTYKLFAEALYDAGYRAGGAA